MKFLFSRPKKRKASAYSLEFAILDREDSYQMNGCHNDRILSGDWILNVQLIVDQMNAYEQKFEDRFYVFIRNAGNRGIYGYREDNSEDFHG